MKKYNMMSNCCSAFMSAWPDSDVCPDCGEHCGAIDSDEVCDHCGYHPSEGACFYCKMDSMKC